MSTVTADVQQQLDATAYWSVPAGDTTLEYPLFVDTTVRAAGVPLIAGIGPGQSQIPTYYSGQGVIVGWRRGLLDSSYYTAGDGFRTNGNAFLYSRGNEWDLGPLGRYSKLTSLTVSFSGLRHGTSWLDGGAQYQVLAGVIGRLSGTFQAEPAPWVLWWDGFDASLKFGFRTGDNVRRVVKIPCASTTVDLVVAVTVDFAAATVTATVNGSPVTVDVSGIGTGWTTGLRLYDNRLWPFAAGRGSIACNNSGFWGTDITLDMTIREVHLSGSLDPTGSWNCQTYFANARPDTYLGGPTLPLFPAFTTYGNKWLLGVHTSQGVPDSVGGTVIRDVTFDGHGNSDSQLVLGSIQAGLDVRNCWFLNNFRGISGTGLGNEYPVNVADCQFSSTIDRGIFLHGAIYSIGRPKFSYANNGCVSVFVGWGSIRDGFHSPGGVPMDSVVDQQGGSLTLDRFASDFEDNSIAIPALLTVTEVDWSSAGTPVVADVRSVGNGLGALVARRPNPTGWAGVAPPYVKVALDGVVFPPPTVPPPPPPPLPNDTSVYELFATEFSPKVGKWYLVAGSGVNNLRINLSHLFRKTGNQITSVTSVTASPAGQPLTVVSFDSQAVDFTFLVPSTVAEYTITGVLQTLDGQVQFTGGIVVSV